MRTMNSRIISLYFYVILFSSCSNYDFSETVSTYPTNPKPGTEVEILYCPSDSELKTVDEIIATIRIYGEKDFNGKSMFTMPNNVIDTEEYSLEKIKGGWVISVFIPDSAVGLIAVFKSGEKVDDGQGLGYPVFLQDANGEIISGSLAGYSAAVLARGWGSNFNKDTHSDTLLSNFYSEFQKNPEKELDFLFSFFTVLKNSKGEGSFDEIGEILGNISANENLTEDKMFFLSAWYRTIKNNEKSDYYKQEALQRYPNGQWAEREASREFYKIEGAGNKKDFLDKHIKNYPFVRSLDYMRGVILADYIQSEDFKGAYNYHLSLENLSLSTRPVFSSIQKLGKTTEEDMHLLSSITESFVSKAREGIKEKNTGKPVLNSSKYWEEGKIYNLANALDASATISSLLGKKREALVISSESYQKSKGKNKQINYRYGNILNDLGNADSAKNIIEKSIASGIEIPEMEDLLKNIYISENGSDRGYENYFSKVKSRAMSDLKGKILDKMVMKQAPSFMLLDTDGKEVKLSDFKSKIVILDFWATWCGPCIKSFPAMQKAMEKYENVKFLFVNSRETAENKLEAVTELMEEGSYPFHVLMDVKDEVFGSYEISFLPTKIIIDGNQKIRYESVGYLGETELLDELENLINILGDTVI